MKVWTLAEKSRLYRNNPYYLVNLCEKGRNFFFNNGCAITKQVFITVSYNFSLLPIDGNK